jgi:SAM-dependent methyltransferase
MAGLRLDEKSRFTTALAKSWPDFVDCAKRLSLEGPFLKKVLKSYRSGLLLDAALGMGCESMFLIENGFTVISNEINNDLVEIAISSSLKRGVKLNLRQFDWRTISRRLPIRSIDAILVLGNSLCLVRKSEQIRTCLEQFYELLKPGGCLIVDERNFPYIMSAQHEILAGRFRFSGKYMYCGSDVIGRPIKISQKLVTFGYFKNSGDLIGTLEMYAFSDGELQRLLEVSGFRKIKKYYDFKIRPNRDADFFTYTAVK